MIVSLDLGYHLASLETNFKFVYDYIPSMLIECRLIIGGYFIFKVSAYAFVLRLVELG